jgi:hypothetical protein
MRLPSLLLVFLGWVLPVLPTTAGMWQDSRYSIQVFGQARTFDFDVTEYHWTHVPTSYNKRWGWFGNNRETYRAYGFSADLSKDGGPGYPEYPELPFLSSVGRPPDLREVLPVGSRELVFSGAFQLDSLVPEFGTTEWTGRGASFDPKEVSEAVYNAALPSSYYTIVEPVVVVSSGSWRWKSPPRVHYVPRVSPASVSGKLPVFVSEVDYVVPLPENLSGTITINISGFFVNIYEFTKYHGKKARIPRQPYDDSTHFYTVARRHTLMYGNKVASPVSVKRSYFKLEGSLGSDPVILEGFKGGLPVDAVLSSVSVQE